MLKLLGLGVAILGLGPTELIVILLILFLIFGATQLPKLGRAIGESMHELRRSVRGSEEDEEEEKKEKAKESAEETTQGKAEKEG